MKSFARENRPTASPMPLPVDAALNRMARGNHRTARRSNPLVYTVMNGG